MRIIVIGAKGMLGQDMVEACSAAGMDPVGLDLPEFDITEFSNLDRDMPMGEWVVNCAAYTRVDDAERDRETAFKVNYEGVRSVARVCAKRNQRLIHLSTDYVFDGRAMRPYEENDRTNPLNVYGASKLAGEKALRAEGAPFLIVRAQSLFGKHGSNFVRSIASKLKENDEPLRVVKDQVSSPTYTRHLAQALIHLMQAGADGVVHVSATGSCSWYDFAMAIAARLKPEHPITPITARELNRPAQRPPHAVLSNKRYASWTGQVMPEWEEGLSAYLKEEQLV